MSAVHSAVREPDFCKQMLTLLPVKITAVTHHIPYFLRIPAEALIGEQCYSTLVYDFDITDVDCLKYSLSKGLGFGIVVGGGIIKIPQIVTIVSTRSAKGLSLSAYALETVAYAINLAYNSRNNFPFSTYGENFFLTIQNVIITLLVVYFAPQRGAVIGANPLTSKKNPNGGKVFTGIVITIATGLALWSEQLCPLTFLSLLQAATLPLSIISKAPQIIQNHKSRSTGNLSAFAVFNGLLGCVARLFTTKQEVNDPLIFWGFAAAAAMNAILALQVFIYRKSDDEILEDRRHSASERGDHVVLEKPVVLEGGNGKRWARKLD
ncbi:mannose-P-dolichol utilization defect 1 [Cryptococcus wingfieldii CBS 7118]|uniref:Mannose-P-dolichol utilization defect 1 protein homolog n=1 Tax=Cryptococcus wingfieldii CBS 7118 TaxID=1295528 RepID=A0A1E3K5T6_9TREE|nr:mannose-P-dolichol utilization defect 1 [Cryptococcus wingfieldii CBS 7118]ODO08538.1 mannose-P-dolichol utilization defect 1 [Cryptococcus wingfieldii CBS 7118]